MKWIKLFVKFPISQLISISPFVHQVLGAFAIFWKSSIASSCLFVRPSFELPLDASSRNFIFQYFPKFVEYVQASRKLDRNDEYSTWKPILFFIISRSFLLSIRNVSDKSCRENQNTKFIFNNFFFRKSCPLWDNTEKYITAGQATDDNMALKHCMLVRTATNTQSMKYFWFIHSYISFTKALCLHYLPCYILQSKEPHKQFWWTLCTKTFGLEHCSLDMLLCDCDEFG